MAVSKILKKEKIYQGHAFDVEKVLIRLPDDRERTYDLVDHANAVTILPIDDEGMVYFVRQFRVGAEKDLLELPAGVMDEGEDPLISAHRELREEIGKDASQMLPIGGFYMAAGYSSEYMRVFLATGLTDSPLDHDEDEFLSIEKVLLNQAYEMVRNGQLQDGKSLSAFLLALPYLNELLIASG